MLSFSSKVLMKLNIYTFLKSAFFFKFGNFAAHSPIVHICINQITHIVFINFIFFRLNVIEGTCKSIEDISKVSADLINI